MFSGAIWNSMEARVPHQKKNCHLEEYRIPSRGQFRSLTFLWVR
jgi:hypothetical protein